MNQIISVVIATRDRPEKLMACLRSLQCSALPADWVLEVIIVDNGGYDGAVEAAARSLARESFAVQFLTEARRGKAVAVNTGTTAARGAIVAFLDDDVTVDDGWTTSVVDEFQRDPKLDLLGGRVMNADPSTRGVAISRRDETFDLAANDPLEGLAAGCNLAVRRHVISAVHGRDTRLGPGTGLAYEDIDFIRRVLRAGFHGRFSPRPVVFHHPGSRNRSVEYPRGRGAYYLKFILRGDAAVARHAWWELNGLARGVLLGSSAQRDDALRISRHLAVGAAVMCWRLLRRAG
jgi:O-antigen biosynthesis protein